ncbi:hypothetical protein D3C87_1729670 [compost metagenome]
MGGHRGLDPAGDIGRPEHGGDGVYVRGATKKAVRLRGKAFRQAGRGVAVDHQQAVRREGGPVRGHGVGHG